MNTPYKLFVTSVNMMQEHIEIIATETSISTNGRQHMLQKRHVVIQYESLDMHLTTKDTEWKRNYVLAIGF